MLDAQFIRDNVSVVKKNMEKKGLKSALVDDFLASEKKWRELKGSIDELRRERNEVTSEIMRLKKEGKDASKALARAKELPEKIKSSEAELEALRTQVDTLQLQIPNIMHESVPIGKDDSENVEVARFGKPTKFKFDPKNHIQIAEGLGVADFDLASKTSGTGFYFMSGQLAQLNLALIKFAVDEMVKKGYDYVETPLMLRGDVIKKVTDLNDQEKMVYKIDGEDLYLIGTSEHSLIGRFIDATLPESLLPLKNTSYSMCFRKEIGAHGINEKGFYRRHQFNKIEMVVICKPEDSMKYYREMKKITVDLFRKLGIPVRELAICSGDLGNLKHVQVDIEAWSPQKQAYYEVGSCSNLTTAQAYKLNIKAAGKTGKYYPHTLNNTVIATSRGLVAILENFQQKDGSVKIPKALWKYTGFKVMKKK